MALYGSCVVNPNEFFLVILCVVVCDGGLHTHNSINIFFFLKVLKLNWNHGELRINLKCEA
jgi:hypothetical protein